MASNINLWIFPIFLHVVPMKERPAQKKAVMKQIHMANIPGLYSPGPIPEDLTQ